jgi:hypothetical protein
MRWCASFCEFRMASRNVFRFIGKNKLPLFVLLLLCVPPYASKGYLMDEALQLNVFILTQPIKNQLLEIYPIFNMLALLMLFLVLSAGKVFTRVFSGYVGLSYVLFAVVQNVSLSEDYGFAVCLSNVALFLFVSASWFYDFKVGQNDFSRGVKVEWKGILFLPALLAIWQPVDRVTMGPGFNPISLISSGSGLTFCMMTTVYLSVLLYFYPKINRLALRVTSMIGLLIGLGNLWLEWIYFPHLWWVGILHLPLVIMSGCGLWLSYRVRVPN